MNFVKYLDYDCARLANDQVELLVTQSLGPRILSLRLAGSDNLFAELPDMVTTRPDGKPYHFIGGHRLWHAPEHMPRTYVIDDSPVEIDPVPNGLVIRQPVEAETGIQKTILLELEGNISRLAVTHTLTNQGLWAVECAPWAITQLKTGGLAILPQADAGTGLLPNRSLVLWPYTDMSNENVTWGRQYVLLHARMKSPFKIGFPNPRGWLAYWQQGVLFVKRAGYQAQASYGDFGSSSECYCNNQFIELETIAPLGLLQPGESLTHLERWELYKVDECPQDENQAASLAQRLELG